MNRVPVWFERKFDFTFPLELHPTLCARLRGTPARLEELVQGSRGEGTQQAAKHGLSECVLTVERAVQVKDDRVGLRH